MAGRENTSRDDDRSNDVPDQHRRAELEPTSLPDDLLYLAAARGNWEAIGATDAKRLAAEVGNRHFTSMVQRSRPTPSDPRAEEHALALTMKARASAFSRGCAPGVRVHTDGGRQLAVQRAESPTTGHPLDNIIFDRPGYDPTSRVGSGQAIAHQRAERKLAALQSAAVQRVREEPDRGGGVPPISRRLTFRLGPEGIELVSAEDIQPVDAPSTPDLVPAGDLLRPATASTSGGQQTEEELLEASLKKDRKGRTAPASTGTRLSDANLAAKGLSKTLKSLKLVKPSGTTSTGTAPTPTPSKPTGPGSPETAIVLVGYATVKGLIYASEKVVEKIKEYLARRAGDAGNAS